MRNTLKLTTALVALTELGNRRIQDLAHRFLAARGARLFPGRRG